MNFMMKKTYTGNVTGPLIMIILLSNAICTNKRVLDILADNVFLNCFECKIILILQNYQQLVVMQNTSTDL